MVEVDDLLTPAECEYFIEKAEEAAAKEGWGADSHDQYETKDVKVKNLGPTTRKLFIEKVQLPLLDILAEQFKLPRDQVSVDDAFIVRYAIGPGEQRELAWHRDGSIVSAIFSLSSLDDYIGGGTMFKDGNCYCPQKGSGIIFAGQRLHGGLAIQAGVRYITTLFFRCEELSCRNEAVARDRMDEARARGEEPDDGEEDIAGELLGSLGGMVGWRNKD